MIWSNTSIDKSSKQLLSMRAYTKVEPCNCYVLNTFTILMLPSLQQVNVYNNYYGRFFYLELLI